jgi:hypothetical protein
MMMISDRSIALPNSHYRLRAQRVFSAGGTGAANATKIAHSNRMTPTMDCLSLLGAACGRNSAANYRVVGVLTDLNKL